MILISNLALDIKDGSTIASTQIYGKDKKTYINIGSGNVFKLEWSTPTLTNDTVDCYSLIIKRHDTTLNVYYDIFNKNIGLVNEFYVDSSLLPVVPLQYMLSIYVVAYGKQGSIITSNVVNTYISKGSGTYVKVEDGYTQPIMKRALAFVYTPDTLVTADGSTIIDNEGNTIYALDESVLKTEDTLVDFNGGELTDSNGELLIAKVTKVLSSTTCNVVQEGYTKEAEGNWHTNDNKYEVLVDKNGEIVTSKDNEPIIYIL